MNEDVAQLDVMTRTQALQMDLDAETARKEEAQRQLEGRKKIIAMREATIASEKAQSAQRGKLIRVVITRCYEKGAAETEMFGKFMPMNIDSIVGSIHKMFSQRRKHKRIEEFDLISHNQLKKETEKDA